MKTLKRLLAVVFVLALIVSLSGCFGMYKKIIDGILDNSDNTQDNTTQTDESPDDTNETEAKSNQEEFVPPTAGGDAKKIYCLYFEIPTGTATNPYSGMLGVWEYYTTELGQPGVDIMVMVSGLGEKTLKEYVETDSKPAHSTGVTPFVEEKINGQTWYTCNNGTIYYFGGAFDGDVYEIEIKSVAGDPTNLRDKAIDLMRKTLAFHKSAE